MRLYVKIFGFSKEDERWQRVLCFCGMKKNKRKEKVLKGLSFDILHHYFMS